MIRSCRTVLVAFVGLAALVIAAPGFAGDTNILVQLAEPRAAAPNFVGISRWFNSAPLSISDLRGKVVLVDFWTYGCYNCVNTLPYVTKLYETYKEKGLVVVGIHTPEFPFERSAGNVQAR
jgi:thiol-disulfide isomerase/thioredoxin